MPRILIVEDESEMLRGLKDNFEFEHYEVDEARDGEAALKKLQALSYDLVILDVMLPKLSGFEVCKRVREKGITTPIVMLTARGEEIDKVTGLEFGADDYVTKPFGVRELLARVKALLRRADTSSRAVPERLVLGGLEIDFGAYTASRDGDELNLTAKEYDILKYLWHHKNKTVTREELLTNVWGYADSMSTRTVDNFILKLRQKIEMNPADPRLIITIHGIGYKLIS